MYYLGNMGAAKVTSPIAGLLPLATQLYVKVYGAKAATAKQMAQTYLSEVAEGWTAPVTEQAVLADPRFHEIAKGGAAITYPGQGAAGTFGPGGAMAPGGGVDPGAGGGIMDSSFAGISTKTWLYIGAAAVGLIILLPMLKGRSSPDIPGKE